MIAVASCFSQLLSLVDRAAFARAVREHQAERGAKGFSCWEQFVAMLFCQMGGAHLREICGFSDRDGEAGALGFASSTDSLDSGLCQYSSALAALSACVRGFAQELPSVGCHEKVSLSFQASASKSGHFGH